MRSRSRLIQGEEGFAINAFGGGKFVAEARDFNGAVLEAAFLENGHVHPGQGADAARDNFAFQRVKAADVVIGEFDKGNSFGDFDNSRAGEWAEAFETKLARRGIGAGIGTAEAAAVGERMLDASDAPPFLVKHQIVNNAANGEFRIFLDGIVLEVFVAAIAIEDVAPIGITLANAAEKCEAHGGAFDIKRFVIFDDVNNFGIHELREIGPDRFEEKFEIEFFQKIAGLRKVRS